MCDDCGCEDEHEESDEEEDSFENDED